MDGEIQNSAEPVCGPWFPDIRLPTLSGAPQYPPEPPPIPEEQKEPLPVKMPTNRRRGPPMKLKSILVNEYNIRKFSGTPFNFQTVQRVLLSHLKMFAGIKKRKRVKIYLRQDSAEGRAILKLMNRELTLDPCILDSSNVCSSKDLKKWLSGELCESASEAKDAARVRNRLFRLICILKCFGIDEHFAEDFSVTANEGGGAAFKQYLCSIVWEDLKQEGITEEEIRHTLEEARSLQHCAR